MDPTKFIDPTEINLQEILDEPKLEEFFDLVISNARWDPKYIKFWRNYRTDFSSFKLHFLEIIDKTSNLSAKEREMVSQIMAQAMSRYVEFHNRRAKQLNSK